MWGRPADFQRYFRDLRHRKVLRVAVVYLLVGWLLMQIAEATFGYLLLPEWANRLVIVLIVLGFPLALVLAWAWEPAPASDAGEEAETAPAGPSIAVLPFVDMSETQDQAHFCEGMAEEITNALVAIRKLRVASRTSATKYRDAALDSREIGKELGVGALLEGSVRKSGDRLRISVELTKVADGYHLWAQKFDRQLEDVFAVQEEIARHIAEALELSLSPGERRAIQRLPTRDIQAYDFYLRGRQFFQQYSRKGMEFARDMYQRAIELDPDYAPAYAGLADACVFLYHYTKRHESLLRCAEETSRKALELATDSAQVHASRGQVLSLSGRHEEAQSEFAAAIELDPELVDAHYYRARGNFLQGRLEAAVEGYERTMELCPEDFRSPLLIAQMYSDLGREEDARAVRRRGVRVAEEHLSLHPDDSRALYMAANGLMALGERERSLELAGRALKIDPDEAMVLYNVACIYSLGGETEQALDYLERAMTGGGILVEWFEHDSNLDPLRDEERFRALLADLHEE